MKNGKDLSRFDAVKRAIAAEALQVSDYRFGPAARWLGVTVPGLKLMAQRYGLIKRSISRQRRWVKA